MYMQNGLKDSKDNDNSSGFFSFLGSSWFDSSETRNLDLSECLYNSHYFIHIRRTLRRSIFTWRTRTKMSYFFDSIRNYVRIPYIRAYSTSEITAVAKASRLTRLRQPTKTKDTADHLRYLSGLLWQCSPRH